MLPPPPKSGGVIRYNYLWRDEQQQGFEEGFKARPACVALHHVNECGETMMFVLPITHTKPKNPDHGILLPPETKKRLGLDNALSWVVVNECNKFTWPGYDIRRLNDDSWFYGELPRKLAKRIVEAFKQYALNKRLGVVNRDY